MRERLRLRPIRSRLSSRAPSSLFQFGIPLKQMQQKFMHEQIQGAMSKFMHEQIQGAMKNARNAIITDFRNCMKKEFQAIRDLAHHQHKETINIQRSSTMFPNPSQPQAVQSVQAVHRSHSLDPRYPTMPSPYPSLDQSPRPRENNVALGGPSPIKPPASSNNPDQSISIPTAVQNETPSMPSVPSTSITQRFPQSPGPSQQATQLPQTPRPVPSPVPAVQTKIPQMPVPPLPGFVYDEEDSLEIVESSANESQSAAATRQYSAPDTPKSPPRPNPSEPIFHRTFHGTPTLPKSSSMDAISISSSILSGSPKINDLRSKGTPRKRSRSRSKSYEDRDRDLNPNFDNKYRRSESNSSLHRFRDDERDVRQQSMDRSTLTSHRSSRSRSSSRGRRSRSRRSSRSRSKSRGRSRSNARSRSRGRSRSRPNQYLRERRSIMATEWEACLRRKDENRTDQRIYYIREDHVRKGEFFIGSTGRC